MTKINKIVGVVLRILAIIYVFVLMIGILLQIVFSSLPQKTDQIPQIAILGDKIFGLTMLVIFVYGFFMLIKNNRKYLRLFVYSLPIYYLGLTIYRYFFITHGQFESADFSNLWFFLGPLVLMLASYKLEPVKVVNAEQLLNQTPEPFSPLQFQGILVRGSANIIDQIVLLIPVAIYALITNSGSQLEANLGIYGGIFLIYLIVTEAVWGQTIGKKVYGIRVMMKDGRKCTLLGAILRNVFRMIDLITGGYLLAMIVMTISPKKQRIGDLIAGTVVVKP